MVLAPATDGTRRRIRLTGAAPALVMLAVLGLGACGDDRTRTERFCDRLREDAAVLSAVPPTPDGPEQVIEAYHRAGEVAPLAIEEDWNVILAVVESAAVVDPTDTSAIEQVRADAVAATQAIERVTAFAAETCGVGLGQLAAPATTGGGSTVAPGSPVPAGTLPPTSG